MVNYVDRDTVLCISLAARPSNHGVRFHNWLYDKLGLNYLYKAVAPTDIAQAVAGIRGLGIRGAGVSMPYKQAHRRSEERRVGKECRSRWSPYH